MKPCTRSASLASSPNDHRRTLVVRRGDNVHWKREAAAPEVDETILDGLRRELAEETGLGVEVGNLTGGVPYPIYSDISSFHGGDRKHRFTPICTLPQRLIVHMIVGERSAACGGRDDLKHHRAHE